MDPHPIINPIADTVIHASILILLPLLALHYIHRVRNDIYVYVATIATLGIARLPLQVLAPSIPSIVDVPVYIPLIAATINYIIFCHSRNGLTGYVVFRSILTVILYVFQPGLLQIMVIVDALILATVTASRRELDFYLLFIGVGVGGVWVIAYLYSYMPDFELKPLSFASMWAFLTSLLFDFANKIREQREEAWAEYRP